MSKRSARKSIPTVADFCSAMETIAPTALAQSWDNVGLLAGDATAPLRRVLLAIDLTRAVLEEAVRFRADLLLAYHPPIFKPISSLRASGDGMDARVFDCIRNGIAIYSTHTALDATEGGTNDALASLCGVTRTEPLEYVDKPGASKCKLVTFVPEKYADRVAGSMFAAGAGRIGDYDCCSFRTGGLGTFFGRESTNPAVGKKGRLESVPEIRLETIVPTKRLAEVIAAIRATHPYEEPAFDIYPLQPPPVRGIGRIGPLDKPTTLASLARKLRIATHAAISPDSPPWQGGGWGVIGEPRQRVERVIVVAGAAGSLPFRIPLSTSDAIVTGEIRHHDALTIRRIGCSAVALGHWVSERPVLTPLAARLSPIIPTLDLRLSRADSDPFRHDRSVH
jgi:dinuclear metal center YbgI/SA1388 family protein